MRRSVQKCLPIETRHCASISIFVCTNNGGGRPPEIVVIFCIPAGDAGVSESYIERGKKAGAFDERQLARGREGARDGVPVARRRFRRGKVRPEPRDCRLFRSSGAGVFGADGLDFIKGVGPLRAL